nr:MAG TPA: hypothetical protein [Caudoviricetes sp.]
MFSRAGLTCMRAIGQLLSASWRAFADLVRFPSRMIRRKHSMRQISS